MATPTTYGTGGYTEGTSGNNVLVGLAPGQLSGGNGSDNIHGSSGNDVITGGGGNDFLWGGAGDDTFLFHAADVNGNTGYDKIFDFEGAGVAHGDRLTFYGFGVGSSITLVGHQDLSGTLAGQVIYSYLLTDTATGHSETLSIQSVNGLALTSGDFAFYGSVGVPA